MTQPEITATHITARRGRDLHHIPIAQVSHFTFADKYLSAHVDGLGEVLLHSPLHAVVALYGDQLVRAHRSVAVFRDRFDSICWQTNNTRQLRVRTASGLVLVPISRSQLPVVRKALLGAST